MTSSNNISASQSTPPEPGSECPIRVGDEVTGLHDPRLQGRVVRIHLITDLPQCVVEISNERTVSVPPWALVPANGQPSAQWREQMDTYLATERRHAAELLHREYCQTAARAADLARQLGGMAAELRAGRFPDTSQTLNPPAGDLDGELGDLADFRDLLAAAGLAPTPESRSTGAALDPDRALGRFRDLNHRIREENNTYTTRADGTEDPGACAEHHDRLEALYAEAADTMTTLDAYLTTGGQLPAAWSDAHP